MLRCIGWILKVTLFTAMVLILGSLIRFNGKTVSDQVKTQLAQVERPTGLYERAKHYVGNWIGGEKKRPRAKTETESMTGDAIPASERQKLRALIRELNSRREQE